MTHRILSFLSIGILTCGLALNAAQAQNDLAPIGDGPVAVELTAPIPLPTMRGDLLYENGPLVNCVGCGVGGLDESVLQTTSLSMNTLGFGHQIDIPNRVADDFIVPDPGWDVNEIVTYAYQSFTPAEPSTITVVGACIWDGPPGGGGAVIWGDCTSNIMTSTVTAGILRVTEETTGANSDRYIRASTSDAVVTLAPGTYWLDWASDGTSTSGPWAPPVTITGQCVTGNGLQFTNTSGIWNPALDSGVSACQQDFPFQIYGQIVPVELISFDAIVSGSDVSLSWATSSETNNAGFEVQMQNGEGWDVLGFVDGHGTTTEGQTYSYTAEGMAVGIHTFRLKQIDFDGRFEYHGDLEVTVETPGTHLISSAYPNPFNPQSQFTLAVAQDQHVTAELFNTLGQRVAVLFDGTVEANQAQLVTIDGAGLASGMYVVRVNGERFSDALSVTLLK